MLLGGFCGASVPNKKRLNGSFRTHIQNNTLYCTQYIVYDTIMIGYYSYLKIIDVSCSVPVRLVWCHSFSWYAVLWISILLYYVAHTIYGTAVAWIKWLLDCVQFGMFFTQECCIERWFDCVHFGMFFTQEMLQRQFVCANGNYCLVL